MSKEAHVHTTLVSRLCLIGILGVAAVAGVSAQSGKPAWSSEAFDHLQTTTSEYTESGNGQSILERWLLQNSRVNVYIHGTDDDVAVYSFRVDDEYRVLDLQPGPHPDPTLRITMSRQTLANVVAADDTAGAVQQAIASGRIRVERVVTIAGVPITIGMVDAFIGVSGLAVILFITTKYGASGLLTGAGGVLKNVLGGLIRLAQRVWQNLAQIATGLTVLEQLGLLQRVKDRVRGWREWLRERFGRREE